MEKYSTRTMCDIIEDMRTMYKTRNFSYLMGLLEELQYRANRIENAFDIKDQVERYEKLRIKYKKEIAELKKEKVEAGGELTALETYM
jgi:hypothetical protein